MFISQGVFSEEIEAQLRSIESQYSKKNNVINYIDTAVYSRYINNVKIKVGAPNIVKIEGDYASISINVSYEIDNQALWDINNAISHYIWAELRSSSQTGYPYNVVKYECKGECDFMFAKEVWNELSKKALGIEVSYLGKRDFKIVIGQDIGYSGSVIDRGSSEFKLKVPKKEIKNGIKPVVNLVKYDAKWDYRGSTYVPITSKSTPSENIILN